MTQHTHTHTQILQFTVSDVEKIRTQPTVNKITSILCKIVVDCGWLFIQSISTIVFSCFAFLFLYSFFLTFHSILINRSFPFSLSLNCSYICYLVMVLFERLLQHCVDFQTLISICNSLVRFCMHFLLFCCIFCIQRMKCRRKIVSKYALVVYRHGCVCVCLHRMF